jgi:hypothetical protein
MILLLNGVSAGPASGPALHHVAQPDGRVLDITVLILPGAYFRGEHPAAVHPGYDDRIDPVTGDLELY